MSARMVFNWLCWLSTKSHWPVSCHTTSQVMLPTDLATFGAIYSAHGSLWRCQYLTCVFPCHFVAPHHPQPTTPMKSLVVLVKKLSKMAGNSASKPLNCTPNELPCITVEWWRIAWKKLCAFLRYTAFNISNRYF